MIGRTAAVLAALAVFAAAPARAKDLAYTADLRGDHMPTMTGSKATGTAHILVHTDTRTVDMTLDVQGLKIGDLWTKLVFAPIGPVHMHIYGSHDHNDPSSSALLVPFPFGADYAPTADGFQVKVKDYSYAQAAATVKATASFDDFISSLNSGRIVLNIHTNKVTDGEISGEVVPAR